MADKVTWFELPADDANRASTFYQQVFGWTGSDMGGGSFAMQSSESGEDMVPKEPGSINGDISPRSDGFDSPLIVISVDDMDAKLSQVEAAGGNVVSPKQTIEEMGIIWSIVRDTEGNHIGLSQVLHNS